uniref:Uncharacterized protein n=1 Tax=Tanacetum cinerariifolium TaxID=118510 RepID=A0A6L2KNE2_TANCI|nr:hypothetical protein [Tanacetum cinerariifolium]
MSTLADFMILSDGKNHPPMLEKHLYDSWKSKMELYMKNREHGRMILESVEHGSGKVLNEEELEFLAEPIVVEGLVTQTIITHNAAYQADDLDAYDSECDDFFTAKAVLMANLSSYKSNVLSEKLRQLIQKLTLLAEVKTIGTNVNAAEEVNTDDYALWEVIENGVTLPKTQVMEGVMIEMPITSAEEKAQRRLEQYENFTASSLEMPDQTFDRLQKLVSQLELLGENLSQEDINQKLLRSLSPEWNTYAVVWRNKVDLDTMSIYYLYNNLKVYELEVKGMSSSNSSTQNMAFVSSSNNNSNSTNGAVNTAQAVNTTHGVSTAST